MRYLFFASFLLLACSSQARPTIQTVEPSGDWRINGNGFKFSISIAQQGEKYVVYQESACGERYDSAAFDGGYLHFRRLLPGATQWYRIQIEDGVMTGRFSHAAGNRLPEPELSAFKYHITGWNDAAFPITPAVFSIDANGYQGRLRIDKSGDQFVGTIKFHAYRGALKEDLEEAIEVTQWDGETIAFTRPRCHQRYTGVASSGNISGSFTRASGVTSAWSATRAEVLTYGLKAKTEEDRQSWQDRTRRILHRLMMAGNPAPLSVNVEILREGIPPISGALYPLRDDDPAAHPQNYTLTELRLTYTVPNWLGGDPIPRVVHAYLAKPNGAGPYPLVLAVNGHGGSAYQTMDGSTLFYYGDAFARRGYMVLAVDISHRPPSDRFGYTEWVENGDDPAHGNVAHPSIKPIPDKYATDWEEDGERAWDVMRALDYALSRVDVDPGKIVVTGLSMGGEVASYVGALDPRITVTIPAGFSPDLNVMRLHGNHGCWTWAWAELGDYIDQSDILALIAPRGLIVQTGKQDRVFSDLGFAGDKQVMRRARIAGGSPIHLLHSLIHEWQGGQIMQPTIIAPLSPGDLTWQTNGETATDGRTVFDVVAGWLGL